MIETPIWRDGHLHLRQKDGEGNLLFTLAPFTNRFCSEAVIMPNTVPAIENTDDVTRYQADCNRAGRHDYTPLMTIKLTPNTTPLMGDTPGQTTRRRRRQSVSRRRHYQ